MELRPGDFFATVGKGPASRIIQIGTLSKYSHIGCFYSPNVVIEATQLRGFTGVVKHSIDDLESYDGSLYHLRMEDKLYEDLDIDQFRADLDSMVGTKYDIKQALLSGVDWFWYKRFKTEFDKSKLFCSELASITLQNQGLISKLVNPSEMTPKDFVSMPIWNSVTKFKVIEGEVIWL